MPVRHMLTAVMLLGALVLTLSAAVSGPPSQATAIVTSQALLLQGLFNRDAGQMTLAFFAPQKGEAKDEKKDEAKEEKKKEDDEKEKKEKKEPPPPKPPKPSPAKPK